MTKAIVHTVSPRISNCELTYIERVPVDFAVACQQHQSYCQLLESLGIEVTVLSGNEHFPDAVFIEDTALVFEELAVITRPGADSRRGETTLIEAELSKHRSIAKIMSPATLDGGDVIQVGSTVFVGQTARTNSAGITALQTVLAPFDYEVIPVKVDGCLHLKSAACDISPRSLLVNPKWVDLSPFSDFNVITIDENEPWAANAIHANGTVCLHAGFDRTIGLLRELEFRVAAVNVSEFQKAEGGLSCLSLRFQ